MSPCVAIAVAFTAATSLPRSSSADPAGPIYLTLATTSHVAVARTAPGKAQPIYVPVTPALGVDAARLDIAVLAIVRDSSIQPIRTDALKIEVRPHPLVLAITIDFDAMFVPGTYEVMLGVVPRPGDAAAVSGAAVPAPPAAPAPGSAAVGGAVAAGGGARPGAPVRQELAVKLLLPPASLRPISKLVVDREVPLPFLRYASETPRVIALHEGGATSSIEPVVTQVGMLTFGDRPIGARITVESFPRIEPGREGAAELELSGDVPIGTVTGTLLVTARELPAPVTIPIEIRSHRPVWWVFVLFLIGAVAGLMWRTRLVAKQGELRAKLRLARVGAEIDGFLAEYPPDWHKDVATLRTRRRELVSGKPETITAAEEALRNAHAGRDARIEQLAAEVERGIAVTRRSWRLPLGLELVQAASSYDLARSALEHGELAVALRWGANATALLSGIVTQGQGWAARLEQALTVTVPDGLSAGIPAPARAAVASALATLQGVLAAARGPFAKAEDGLEKLAEAWAAAAAFASLLREAFAAFVRGLPAGLAADQLGRLRVAAALPVTRSELPDVAIIESIAAGQRIRDAARTVAAELGGGALSEPIRQAIDDGHFAAALTPPAAVGTAQGRGTPISGRTPTAAAASHDLEIAVSVVPAMNPMAPVVPVDVRRIKSPAEILEDQLDSVSGVRWAIAALFMSFAAWAIYGDAFIGTRIECATLLGLGFVTDLTTDSALEGVLARLKAVRGGGVAPPADPGGTASA